MKNLKKAFGIFCLTIMLLSAVANVQAAAPAKAPGFTDNGNGTVTDQKSGLMWKKCPEGINGDGCANGSAEKFKWQNAMDHVKALNDGDGFAGYHDWRVPSIDELKSIISDKHKDPSINIDVFPNTPFDVLYLSSTFTDDGKNISVVLFSIGKRIWTFRFDVGYLRLVRGGEKKEEKKPETKKSKIKKPETKEPEVKAPM